MLEVVARIIERNDVLNDGRGTACHVVPPDEYELLRPALTGDEEGCDFLGYFVTCSEILRLSESDIAKQEAGEEVGNITKENLVIESDVSRCAVGDITTSDEEGNSADITKRKHAPRGAGHHKAKLMEDDVRRVLYLYGSGQRTQKELAAEYGVSQVAIHKIVTRKSWTHVQLLRAVA